MTKNTSVNHLLPFPISICAWREIDQFENKGITHLLSIQDPHTTHPPPDWFTGEYCRLNFADVETHKDALQFHTTAVSKVDVQKILDFGQKCSSQSHLLVHCWMGASRSPAAAYIILCQALAPGQEKNALDHILKIRSGASPNKLMVRYAEKILQRKGKMILVLDQLREEHHRLIDQWEINLKKKQEDKNS